MDEKALQERIDQLEAALKQLEMILLRNGELLDRLTAKVAKRDLPR